MFERYKGLQNEIEAKNEALLRRILFDSSTLLACKGWTKKPKRSSFDNLIYNLTGFREPLIMTKFDTSKATWSDLIANTAQPEYTGYDFKNILVFRAWQREKDHSLHSVNITLLQKQRKHKAFKLVTLFIIPDESGKVKDAHFRYWPAGGVKIGYNRFVTNREKGMHFNTMVDTIRALSTVLEKNPHIR